MMRYIVSVDFERFISLTPVYGILHEIMYEFNIGTNMNTFIKPKDIGLKIRTFRQNAGLSQEELAERVGVTAQQIQKYETAKTRLTTDRLQLIAGALQVRAAAFFHHHKDDLTLNEKESDFIRRLRKVRNRKIHDSFAAILEALAKG